MMSQCDAYIEKISLYVDGELTAEETAEVEAHLKECGECRSRCEAYSILSDETCALCCEVPDALHGRIMDAVKAERENRRPHRAESWRFRPFTLAAGLVAAVLLVVSGVFGDVSDLYLDGGTKSSSAMDMAPADAPQAMTAESAETPAAAEENFAPAGGAVPEGARITEAPMEDAAGNAQQFSIAPDSQKMQMPALSLNQPVAFIIVAQGTADPKEMLDFMDQEEGADGTVLISIKNNATDRDKAIEELSAFYDVTLIESGREDIDPAAQEGLIVVIQTQQSAGETR